MINIPLSTKTSNSNEILSVKKINYFDKLTTKKYKQNLNAFHIEREFEVKNVYYDSNDNNITDKKHTWSNNLLNNIGISLKWDYKTGIYQFDFSSIPQNFNCYATISINNNYEQKIPLSTKHIGKDISINSINFSKQNKSIKNVNTIQVIFSNSIKKCINIVLGDYKNLKNDFMILPDKELELNFLNKIVIKDWEISKKYTKLKFRNSKLEQGKWNIKFLEINNGNDGNIFDRNDVSIISLDNLPVTSNSKASFTPSIKWEGNKGFLCIDQNTYYDFTKKETIRGLEQNSNPGYIIPFEYSGIFYPMAKFKINDVNFYLSWKEDIKKPYFLKNLGITKINISDYSKDMNNNEKEWYEISQKILKEASEFNFTLNELKEWLKIKTQKGLLI